MTYILLINAEDGRHSHVYATEAKARAGLAEQLGRKTDRLNGTHIDDYGRRLVVEDRPDGWTEAKERRLGEAYDRRECGLSLTKAQRLLLAEFG